ncbi:unnamed protein product [marine sediment metagenome]|uniref:Uncharacterized protein n=1 Tax=marine sediment metagenome TaxID=412755 RepID=X1K7I8_9ZZZZ
MKTIKELIAIEANPNNKMLPRILASLQVDTLKDVLGLNKEVFGYHNKQPITDEFSKGFEHACKVIEEELKKRISG